MVGTARYASENAHKGYELSRRDDLESVGFMMLYLVQGTLPWESIFTSDFTTLFSAIGEMKSIESIEDFCENLPV